MHGGGRGTDDVMPANSTTGETAAGRGRVARLVAQLYRRLGWKVMFVSIAGGCILAILTMAVTVLWLSRYLDASLEQSVRLFLLALGCVIVGLAAGILSSRDALRPFPGWSRTNTNPEAAAATWNAVLRAPALVVRRAAIASSITLSVTVYGVIREFDLPAWSVVPLIADVAIAILAVVVLVRFSVELLQRPMLEDIARYLPDDFDPSAPTWPLSVKAAAPLPIVTSFAALNVGAFVDLAAPGPERLSLALGVALVTVAVATVIQLVVTRSVLQPIDDLMAATRRVRAGDLSTPVPVVTTDELGALAHSFNLTLRDLRERDALRRHNEELSAALEASLADVRRHAEELRASRARIVTAAVAERRRVERDLHDGAQQDLVLLNLKVALARRMVEEDPESAGEMLDQLRVDLGDALGKLRDLAHGIYPPLLVNDGLSAALAEAADRAPIPTSVDCNGSGRYGADLEAAVYFCCLEALQNAAKHAGPGARATLRLTHRGPDLVFEVEDDGHGCDPREARGGSGLQNMADRLGALGGRLEVVSAPGEGTRVIGRIPVGR